MTLSDPASPRLDSGPTVHYRVQTTHSHTVTLNKLPEQSTRTKPKSPFHQPCPASLSKRSDRLREKSSIFSPKSQPSWYLSLTRCLSSFLAAPVLSPPKFTTCQRVTDLETRVEHPPRSKYPLSLRVADRKWR